MLRLLKLAFCIVCFCFYCLQLFWFAFDLEHWLIFLASDRFSGAWIRSWHNASTSPLSTGWSVTANTCVPWMSTMTSILQSLSLSGQRPKRSYKRKRTLQRLCSLWGRWVTSCEDVWCQWAILRFLTASAGFWPCLRPDLMDTALCKKDKWSLGDVRLPPSNCTLFWLSYVLFDFQWQILLWIWLTLVDATFLM